MAEKGAQIIDADKVAHQTMEPGAAAYRSIVEQWGDAVLNADQTIDRAALGKIVFADPQALALLESFVHPAVFEQVQTEVCDSAADVVMIEAIKLLESGRLLPLCDEIWVLTAPRSTQLKRLSETRNMAAEAAERRIAAQSSPADKVAHADLVIANNGSLTELAEELNRQWTRLQKIVSVENYSQKSKR